MTHPLKTSKDSDFDPGYKDLVNKKYLHSPTNLPYLQITVQSYSYTRDHYKFIGTIANTVCTYFDEQGYNAWLETRAAFGGDHMSWLAHMLEMLYLHRDLIKQLVKIPGIISAGFKTYTMIQDKLAKHAESRIYSHRLESTLWINIRLEEPQPAGMDHSHTFKAASQELLLMLLDLHEYLDNKFCNIRFNYKISVTTRKKHILRIDLDTFDRKTLAKLLRRLPYISIGNDHEGPTFISISKKPFRNRIKVIH